MKILYEFLSHLDLSLLFVDKSPEDLGMKTTLFDKYKEMKFDKNVEIVFGRDVKLTESASDEDKVILNNYFSKIPDNNLSVKELVEKEFNQFKEDNIEIVEFNDLLDSEHFNSFIEDIVLKEPNNAEKYILFQPGNAFPISFYVLLCDVFEKYDIKPHPIMEDILLEAMQKDPDSMKRVFNTGTKMYEYETSEKIDDSFNEIFTSDKTFRKVKNLAVDVAKTNIEVLLYGESGTGKELFAQLIHKASGRKGKFVPVNCAAFLENLLESELFGHIKGAFTDAKKDHKGIFEVADKGTVFLDEVAEMSISLQAKLLRVLESKKIRKVGSTDEKDVDVRIICATNKDLLTEVRNDTFREDLYFRLKKIELSIPPLRKRGKKDIAFIFMKVCKDMDYSLVGITDTATKLLLEYDFPGNVRELISITESAIVFAKNEHKNIDEEIIRKSIGLRFYQEFEERKYGIKQNNTETSKQDDFTYIMRQFLGKVNIYDGFKLHDFLNSVEKHYIKESLKIYKTQKKAGTALGYTQQNISTKIKKYNIDNRQVS